MNTRTLFFLIALLAMTVNLSAINKQIKGNKKIITRTVQISDFNEVEIAGSMAVEYTQKTGSPTFEITVDENIFPYINIEVKGNKLVVCPKKINDKSNNSQSYNLSPSNYRIKISSPQLQAVNSAGSGSFKVISDLMFDRFKVNKAGSGNVEFIKPIKGKEMNIEMAGSGHVFVKQVDLKAMDCSMAGSGNVRVNGTITDGKFNMAGSGFLKVDGISNNADLNMAGSGHIEVNGTVDKAKLSLAGSGKIKAFDCKAKEVKADVTGSGRVEISVSNSLITTVSGSGEVLYKGSATIDDRSAKKKAVRKVN